MRPSLFWDVTQQRLVVDYQHVHNGPAVQEWDCLNLEYGTYTIYQPRLVKAISSEL
jgi:hypothetical protein